MMTTFQAASLVLDAVAVVLIGAGIAAMIIGTMRRERESARAATESERRHAEAAARHEEAMLALRTLIERTGGARDGEWTRRRAWARGRFGGRPL